MPHTEFLSPLVGDSLDDGMGTLTIWTLSNKRSGHFESVEEAEKHIARWRGKSDIYYGAALRKTGLGPGQRGGMADLTAVLALWADIDVHVEGVHADTSLPPSKESARSIVGAMGHPPSVVIDSGNGLQALWLLSEPWDITTAEERDRATALSKKWEATLAAEARRIGFGYDIGNWNLDRILRMPGTVNYKGEKKEVRVLEITGGRYTAEELEAVCVDTALMAASGASVTFPEKQQQVEGEGGAFTIRRDASPPPRIFELLDADPEAFGGSWAMGRKFSSGDDSPSAYTMSLASIAASAKWSNQEIADLICAFHRRWKEKRDPAYDTMRHGFQWFVTLLHKARRESPVAPVNDAPSDPIEIESAVTAAPDAKAAWLAERLGVGFIRIEQRHRFETVKGQIDYAIVISEVDNPIPLGGEGVLRQPNVIRNRIEAATAHKIVLSSPVFSARRWPTEIYPVLSSAVVLAEDATPAEQLARVLNEYFTTSGGAGDEGATVLELRERRRPYIDGGEVWLHIAPLAGFAMKTLERSDLSTGKIRKLMAICGFQPKTVATENGSRSYLYAPVDSECIPQGAAINAIRHVESAT